MFGENGVRRIKFAGFNVRVPAHPWLRAGLGVLLVIGGIFSFLPLLGLWMLPLGLIILSIDFALVRRFRRKAAVKIGRWLVARFPRVARGVGFSV
jgi:purine-cytosine permease-like protein